MMSWLPIRRGQRFRDRVLRWLGNLQLELFDVKVWNHEPSDLKCTESEKEPAVRVRAWSGTSGATTVARRSIGALAGTRAKAKAAAAKAAAAKAAAAASTTAAARAAAARTVAVAPSAGLRDAQHSRTRSQHQTHCQRSDLRLGAARTLKENFNPQIQIMPTIRWASGSLHRADAVLGQPPRGKAQVKEGSLAAEDSHPHDERKRPVRAWPRRTQTCVVARGQQLARLQRQDKTRQGNHSPGGLCRQQEAGLTMRGKNRD
jgi:hypothetical protein